MDTQWPKWHQLLRAYLQAKGWLTTFDHPIGPGTALNPTPGFDTDINEEIYKKLHSKCWDGTAITYIRMAAEFDGHGAGKALKEKLQKTCQGTQRKSTVQARDVYARAYRSIRNNPKLHARMWLHANSI